MEWDKMPFHPTTARVAVPDAVFEKAGTPDEHRPHVFVAMPFKDDMNLIHVYPAALSRVHRL
jgi:hypothetical protein